MDGCFFDMDGVVVDSERHWVPLENERILPDVVDAQSGEGPTASEITGMNVRDAYAYLDREYGTTVDVDGYLATYDDAARELYDERVELMSGFDSLLADLRGDDVAVALVSSSPHRWIDRVLDRFELRDAFDAVVSAGDVDGPGKPASDVYETAAACVDVDPNAAVAVEDSAHGLAAGRAAGMTAVAYRTTANADSTLEDADVVADGPDELRAVLDERRRA
ncbi:HAD family hydrolase [Halorubellus salinus]|uniref:HAD family hydrolase n=1 Tax=Halorubellus salinus TaxID=755309 RepID=UPI001D08C901|nr:HAD family phosphatase [Halorubellus salinus]